MINPHASDDMGDLNPFAVCVSNVGFDQYLARTHSYIFTFKKLRSRQRGSRIERSAFVFFSDRKKTARKDIIYVELVSLDAARGWQLVSYPNGEVAPFSSLVSSQVKVYGPFWKNVRRCRYFKLRESIILEIYSSLLDRDLRQTFGRRRDELLNDLFFFQDNV